MTFLKDMKIQIGRAEGKEEIYGNPLQGIMRIFQPDRIEWVRSDAD
jgi:hypothetical protein